jgi:phage terminase large subunit-like protein
MGTRHDPAFAQTVEGLLALPPDERKRVLSGISDQDCNALALGARHEWALWERPEQRQPSGSWDTWIMLGGRGSGKTRPGAQNFIAWTKDFPLLAMMAKDDAMVRDVIIEGESGILACSPPWWKPTYDKSKLRLTWPNGAVALKLTAEAGADAGRGRQYYKAWAEEVAAWPNVRAAWNEGLQNCLRLGTSPQCIVTTNAKDPTTPGIKPDDAKFLMDLFLGPKDRLGNRPVTGEEMAANRWGYETVDRDGLVHRTVVVRWSSEKNSANLAPGFVEKRRQQYGESRMGRRELDAEILEKVEGALFLAEIIDRNRRGGVPSLVRVEIAVDPTRSDTPVDEAGIMAGGMDEDGHGYLLEDCSRRGTPNEWVDAAIGAYHRYRADAMVYETNRMGEMVRQLVRQKDPKVKLKEVTASEGKRVRAEPVSALYEQGRCHHVGFFPILEDEMCSWDPASKMSPNRMDAVVWLFSSLLVTPPKSPLRLV